MEKIPRFFSVAISGDEHVSPALASACSGKSAGIPERLPESDFAATGIDTRGSAFKLPFLVFSAATATKQFQIRDLCDSQLQKHAAEIQQTTQY